MKEHKQEDECSEGESQDEYSMEDIIEENNLLLNCLIDLLIEKNIITDKELNNKIKEVEQKVSGECKDDEEDAEKD